jgi:hypothetical protein
MRLGRSKLLGWWFLEVPIFQWHGKKDKYQKGISLDFVDE